MSQPHDNDSTTPEQGFEGMCWAEIVKHTEPDPREFGYGEFIDSIEEAREYAIKALT